jgi:CheY-like chemotaxis protein
MDRFSSILPVNQKRMQEASVQTEARRIKVLVVEDELDVRLFLCNLLDSCGYFSIDADSHLQGLERARTEKPDLIILDAMLPHDSGMQLYRCLKRDEALKEIPVVVLSTLERKTFCHYQKCQCGATIPEPEGYLGKPPEAEDLLKVVKTLADTQPGATMG